MVVRYKRFGEIPSAAPPRIAYDPPATQYMQMSQMPIQQPIVYGSPNSSPYGMQEYAYNANAMVPQGMQSFDARLRAQQMHQERTMDMNPPESHWENEYNPAMNDPQWACRQVAQHIEQCRMCYKLYKRNTAQGALILFLVFVIVILVTKLMDRA